MFSALNIDRNNISNAVSDSMLDDLGIYRADYVSHVFDDASDSYWLVTEHRSNHLLGRFPRG